MDQPFPQLILASILLIAGVTDLRSSKIPNWLTVSAMAAGLLSHSWFDGLSGLLFSVKGLGLGLALFLLFYVMGGMGAGDVKLLAAVGSFLGAEGVVSAGIMAMLFMLFCLFGFFRCSTDLKPQVRGDARNRIRTTSSFGMVYAGACPGFHPVR